MWHYNGHQLCGQKQLLKIRFNSIMIFYVHGQVLYSLLCFRRTTTDREPCLGFKFSNDVLRARCMRWHAVRCSKNNCITETA